MPQLILPPALPVLPGASALSGPASPQPAATSADAAPNDFASLLARQIGLPAGGALASVLPGVIDDLTQDDPVAAALISDLAALLAGQGLTGATPLPELPPAEPLPTDGTAVDPALLAALSGAPAATLPTTVSGLGSTAGIKPALPGLTGLVAAGAAGGGQTAPAVLAAAEKAADAAPAPLVPDGARLAAARDAGPAAPDSVIASGAAEAGASLLDPATGMPVQTPAGLARAERPAEPAGLRVDTPVGHRAWADDVGQKIVWLAGRHEDRAELTLTPPQLGRIEVTLTTSGDQTTALFVSASAAARDALENALPRLREMLAEAGITLGQASVNADSPQRDERPVPSRGREAGGTVAEGGAPTQPGATWLRGGNGLIDTFA